MDGSHTGHTGGMTIYVVAFAVTALGLLTVLFALYWDREVVKGSKDPEPDWDVLPLPADIRHVAYPTSFRGYDPVAVESSLETVAVAYGELLAVTTPEQRARARRNIARRTGKPIDVRDVPETGDALPTADTPSDSALPRDRQGDTTDAIRREAALNAIEDQP